MAKYKYIEDKWWEREGIPVESLSNMTTLYVDKEDQEKIISKLRKCCKDANVTFEILQESEFDTFYNAIEIKFDYSKATRITWWLEIQEDTFSD